MSADSRQREETFATSKSSKSDKLFDAIIGHIEDIMIDETFQNLQQRFLEQHYTVFEDVEENKLAYTDIHQQYVQTVEKFLEAELVQRMPSFNMAEFQKQLVARKKHLDGEVFEVLLTITDFLAFKELVLDYKKEKEGRGFDLGDGFVVRNLSGPKEMPNNTVPLSVSTTNKDIQTSLEPMRMSLEFEKFSSHPEPMRMSFDTDNQDASADNPESMRTSLEFDDRAIGDSKEVTGDDSKTVQEHLNGRLGFLVISNNTQNHITKNS
jgi:ADP-ribosylation factor 2-binding protein